jgi:3-phenylpropionate/trans-cinnamate dioxygenase ferredoxin subunit
VRFVKVAQTSEIPSGSMKNVQVDDAEILIANVDGTFYAVAGRCTHLRGHLSEGQLRDGIVTCPRHGARFDVRTGHAVGSAQLLFLKTTPRDLETYTVKIEAQDVLVGLG